MAQTGASSDTGGVKPVNIEGRFSHERERLVGDYTDADREWRKKWLKDQELSPNEPRRVPELERELRNPIRRFYSKPWNALESLLAPAIGPTKAWIIRFWLPKSLMALTTLYAGYYYLKYNSNDWTKHGSVYYYSTRKAVVPGDSGFPQARTKTEPADYADRGFKARKVFRDI
ncbi:NADH dehydrogenase (ubiquinone) B17 subunit [Tachypleus tridentatus]|uniref:NADH dehydrogenase (ubiquinone) B17 subunit n=1 Tax=Tachypleus tridentatus TaxID=6853 RepID=UPI003FD57316